NGVRGLRIIVDPAWALAQTEPDVRAAFEAALGTFRDLKAEVVEASIPRITESWDPAELITATEALAVYENALRTRPQDIGASVRERMGGAFKVTGIDYARARRLGQILRRNLQDTFEKVDIIASPTCTVAATPIGQQNIVLDGKQLSLLPVLTRLTRVYDLTGNPAISVPCGFSREGLPIGLQLAGPAWNESVVLRAAYAYEQAANWRGKRPAAAPGSLAI
ncbi:MAG: amidase family protein, partial [Terriglobia bacterium]